MKKVSLYVLILGALVGMISGAIFASESPTVVQSGNAATLSGSADTAATSGLSAADWADGPGGHDEPGDSGHGHGGPGGFADFDNPFLLLIATMAILMLLAL